MKEIVGKIRYWLKPKTFESEFEKQTKELVELCFEYVDYDSKNIDEIFIFFSTEFDTIWFNTFYNINGQILGKHKVGDNYDMSVKRQKLLNSEANKIIQKLIQNFKLFDKELPSDFRISYKIDGGKFDCKMNYEPLMEKDPDVSMHTICDEWMEIEAKKLE